MSDIEVQFRKAQVEAENRRMNEFFAKPDPYPYEPSSASAGEEPLGPPAPTTGQKLKSVVGGAATAAKEGAVQGYSHFVKGMVDTWQAGGQASMGDRVKGILSGEGEVALGALTLFITALGVPSAMEAAKKGIAAFAPGMNNSVFLGRDVAKNIRVFLGLPSLIGDPEVRKLMFADLKDLKDEQIVQQQELFEELSKAMTYGEFFELVAGFVIPAGAVKGLKSFKKWTTPTPPPPGAKPYNLGAVGEAAREATKQAREEAYAKSQTKPGDFRDTPTTVPSPGEPTGRPAPQGRRQPTVEEKQALIDQAKKREEAFAQGQTPPADFLDTPTPSPTKTERPPVQGRPQLTPEEQQILKDRAKKLEEVYTKTQTKAPDPLDIETPITDSLRMQLATKSARAPRTGPTMSLDDFATRLQTLVEGSGGTEAPKKAGKGATAPTKGKKKAEEAPKAAEEKSTTPYEEPTSPPEYPDPATELKTAVETAMEQAREVITEELGGAVETAAPKAGVQVISRTKIGEQAPASERFISRQERQLEAGEIEMKRVAEGKPSRMFDESGKISPDLLAQMAVGAAVGVTQGDTLEERIAYGLFGFLGARGATAVARRLAVKFKTDPKVAPLLSPTNPQMPGFAAPPPEVSPQINNAINAIAPKEKGTLHKIIARTEETVLNENERRTGLIIEQKAWEKVKELSDAAAASGTAPAELRDAFALAYTLSKNNEGGKWWGGATGSRASARVKVAKKEIHKLAREWDPSKSDIELARAIHGLGAIENVSLAGRLYYALPEAGLQGFMSGLLLGEALVKNALGTAPMIPLTIVERSLAAFSPRAWLTGAERPGVTEGMRMIGPAMRGIMDQLRMVNKWDKLGEQALKMGTTRMEVMPRGFEALAQISREEFGAPTFAKGLEWLGHAANLAPETMRRTDGSLKAILGSMQARAEAMRLATQEGLKKDAFWDRVKELETDYSKMPEASLQRIKDFRDHGTFTQPFESEIMRAIQMGPTDPWLQLGYRITFFPFVRTGVRLAEFYTEHTPGLNVLAAHTWKEWNSGGVGRSLVEARMATGAMIMAGAGWLTMQGLITGDLPGYPKEGAMEDAGRPRRIFWDPLSQKYRSYDGLEPISTIVSNGVDITYLATRLPEKDFESLATAYGTAFLNNWNSQPLLQSVGQLYQIMTNGSTDAQWEKALQFMRTRLQSTSPVLLKEVFGGAEKKRVVASGAYDKEKSVTSAGQKELKILIDTFRKNVGKSDSETIVFDRNYFTGDIIRDDSWPFNPYTAKATTDAPWAREIRRLEGAGLEELPDWIGKEGPADVGMSDKLEAPGVRLKARQIDRRAVLMTQIVKDAHGKFTESLDQLVQSESYKRADNDNVRKDLIHERAISFRLRAEARLLSEYKELNAAVKLQTGLHQVERYLPRGRQPAARQRLESRYSKPSPGAQP